MELHEHIAILRRYAALIAVIVVVATVAAVVLATIQPESYKVSIAFSVNAQNRQATADYQYDGYYAIKAAELFSQTVMSWFMTPSVLVEMYREAEIDPQISSLETFTSRFKTKQYSSQNFVVIFKERDKATSEKISASIIRLVERDSAALNRDENNNSLFVVSGSTPVIIKSKLAPWLAGVIAFLISLIIGLALAYLLAYLRGQSRGRAAVTME